MEGTVAVACGVLYVLMLSRLWSVVSSQRRGQISERTLRMAGVSLAVAGSVEEVPAAVQQAAFSLIGESPGSGAVLVERKGGRLHAVIPGVDVPEMADPERTGDYPGRRLRESAACSALVLMTRPGPRRWTCSRSASWRRHAIVEGIVRLAATLEVDVIAEGIESETERELLVGMGCRYGQGYLLSVPAAAAAAEALLGLGRGLVPALPRKRRTPPTRGYLTDL